MGALGEEFGAAYRSRQPLPASSGQEPVPPHILIDATRVRSRAALPPSRYGFPDPDNLPSDGLAGVGGDFQPATVIAAYRAGIFPWPHPQDEYLWWSPDPRAVIPIGGLHVSRRLARTIASGRFRVTLDAAFEQVMSSCAEREEGTWITAALIEGYARLHALGWAHSVEVWTGDGALAGGLYGIAVGALFGAESMFHRVTDASKVAMAAMMQYTAAIGVTLVDIQVLTPHSARMGAIEIPRPEYLRQLAVAVERPVDWRVSGR